MALEKKAHTELADLLRQAIEEQRAVNPALFEELRPYTDDEYAQVLADAAEIERIRWYTGAQEGVSAMALNKKADSELADLIQQAAAELRATNPELFEELRPYTDDEYAQVLADAAEIERIWDEMDRARGAAPRRYTGLDAINEDRGE